MKLVNTALPCDLCCGGAFLHYARERLCLPSNYLRGELRCKLRGELRCMLREHKKLRFEFRQCGTHFIKDGMQYTLAIRDLCSQARKAHINFLG